MDLRLRGKVVLVTGSSRGIGLAIAGAFLREGAKVAITGRDGAALKTAAAALAKQHGRSRLLAMQGDLSHPDGIRAALRQTVQRFGGLDAVVANIGSGTGRTGWRWSVEEWESSLNTNLVGSMAVASAALPHLLKRNGSLTFISSIAGREALRAPISYGASKAALQHAAKQLSQAVGPGGVRVNVVAPGNIYFPGGAWDRKMTEEPKRWQSYLNTEVPLRRFGKADEVADAVVFLASARAAFITGACLVVDGGQTRAC